MRKFVFLGGIPGVGKSHLSSALASRIPRLVYLTAGQLIQSELSANASLEYSRPVVRDAADTQDAQSALIRALSKRDLLDRDALIDGHFVVPSETALVPLSIDVFASMKVTSCLLLQAPVQMIAKRLRERSKAGWWNGALESLDDFQRLEERNARMVCEALSLPLLLAGDTSSALDQLLETFDDGVA